MEQLADEGQIYPEVLTEQADVEAALNEEFNEPVFLDDWKLPAGAFGESAGPT